MTYVHDNCRRICASSFIVWNLSFTEFDCFGFYHVDTSSWLVLVLLLLLNIQMWIRISIIAAFIFRINRATSAIFLYWHILGGWLRVILIVGFCFLGIVLRPPILRTSRILIFAVFELLHCSLFWRCNWSTSLNWLSWPAVIAITITL